MTEEQEQQFYDEVIADESVEDQFFAEEGFEEYEIGEEAPDHHYDEDDYFNGNLGEF